ncbi:hypothetical protein BKA93DRAFT_820949 [Sparassis latifolia]
MEESTIPDILEHLGRLLNTPPISVEIFPGDGYEVVQDTDGTDDTTSRHKPFMFLEDNLGVPQKVLHKAYMFAVRSFAKYRREARILDGDRKVLESLVHSSAVLLLANPAHQTALNVRKRLVLCQVIDPAHEMRFVAALLTVREGAKQSILWHHRRWLFRRLCLTQESADPGDVSTPSFQSDGSLENVAILPGTLQHEFKTISQACEVYPRNYHAWAHRYICFDALVALLSSSSPQHSEYAAVLADEYTSMRQWVERHVSDYTAVQYLCNIHTHLPNRTPALYLTPSIAACPGRPALLRDDHAIIAHARLLVEAYPDHESLWLYLRRSLTISLKSLDCASRTDQCVLTFAHEFLAQEPGRAVTNPSLRSLSAADPRVVHTHACRFLAWYARTNGSLVHIGDTSVKSIVLSDIHDCEIGRLLNLQELFRRQMYGTSETVR